MRFLKNRINHTRTVLNFRTYTKHNFRFAKTRQRGFNLRHDFRKTRRQISDVNGYINRGRRSAYTLRQRTAYVPDINFYRLVLSIILEPCLVCLLTVSFVGRIL